MKNITYDKRCGVAQLHQELLDLGFNVLGISFHQGKTIVHLGDAETKDPAPIVEAHVAPPEEPKEQTQEDQRIALELALADQIAANETLNARVTDTELVLADILATQV